MVRALGAIHGAERYAGCNLMLSYPSLWLKQCVTVLHYMYFNVSGCYDICYLVLFTKKSLLQKYIKLSLNSGFSILSQGRVQLDS